MTVNNHKNFRDRLFIDYQYQSINWYRLSSIVNDCHRLSISLIVYVLNSGTIINFNWKFHLLIVSFAIISKSFFIELQCSSDISKPKYTCTRNTRQPNTRIRVRIYTNTHIQCMRVCLISMYELTYCFFFS